MTPRTSKRVSVDKSKFPDYRQLADQFSRGAESEISLENWSAAALSELKTKLSTTPECFTIDRLQIAHRAQYKKELVDIISMVKHAARDAEPLLTAAERVERAFAQLTAGRSFTPASRAIARPLIPSRLC